MKRALLAVLMMTAAVPAFAKDDHDRGKAKNPLTVPLAGNGSLSGEPITSGTLKIVGFTLDQTGQVPVLEAIAILNAQSATHSIVNQAVQVPVLPSGGAAPSGAPLRAAALAAPLISCDVLNLVLGALHLDLLGLVVDLNQVVLDITAQPGPGNLLGNLLCGVLSLLDLPGAVAAVIQLLNNANTVVALLGAL